MFLGDKYLVTEALKERFQESLLNVGDVMTLTILSSTVPMIVLKRSDGVWTGIGKILDLLPEMRKAWDDSPEGKMEAVADTT